MGLFDFFSRNKREQSQVSQPFSKNEIKGRWTEKISLETIFRKSVSFHVERFEEWQAGQCINADNIDFDIHLIANDDKITVNIPNSTRFRMHKTVDFDFAVSDVLSDRIQYINNPDQSTDPTLPIILHIFVKNGAIDYIRFVMSYPDRLIELYGYQIISNTSNPDEFDLRSSNESNIISSKNVDRMKRIVRIWELRDFCYSHGRVIPHTIGGSTDFTRFHCADRSHDDSATIICSDGIGVCEATLSGILTMYGYVVEFADQDEYILCTEQELEILKEESRLAEEAYRKNENESEVTTPENPARPRGLKISRSDMVIEYKAYEKCLDYPVKMHYARSMGWLTPPYTYGDYSYASLICKDDCIFCHCPFYDLSLLNKLRHNHRNDYHEWVLTDFKDFK